MPDFGRSKLNRYTHSIFRESRGPLYWSIVSREWGPLAKAMGVDIKTLIQQNAGELLSQIKTAAPSATGELREGLITHPDFERNAVEGKAVKDIVFDAGKNDRFVKYSKAGIRYYYPASQEFGFKISKGRRVPGLYYMRNTSRAFYSENIRLVREFVHDRLEEL